MVLKEAAFNSRAKESKKEVGVITTWSVEEPRGGETQALRRRHCFTCAAASELRKGQRSGIQTLFPEETLAG